MRKVFTPGSTRRALLVLRTSRLPSSLVSSARLSSLSATLGTATRPMRGGRPSDAKLHGSGIARDVMSLLRGHWRQVGRGDFSHLRLPEGIACRQHRWYWTATSSPR